LSFSFYYSDSPPGLLTFSFEKSTEEAALVGLASEYYSSGIIFFFPDFLD
jgi:hypothetical protein